MPGWFMALYLLILEEGFPQTACPTFQVQRLSWGWQIPLVCFDCWSEGSSPRGAYNWPHGFDIPPPPLIFNFMALLSPPYRRNYMKIFIPKRAKVSGKKSKTKPQTKWVTPSHSPPKQLKGFWSGGSAGGPNMDLLWLILHLALRTLELSRGKKGN